MQFNAMVRQDPIETINHIALMVQFETKCLKQIARETGNSDLLALSLLSENNYKALQAVEINLEDKEENWEPGVEQVTPATP